METNHLSIVIDASGVDETDGALQRLTDASAGASTALASLAAYSETGAAALTGFTTETKGVSETPGGGGSGTTTFKSAADKTAASLSRSASSALSSALSDVVIDGESFSEAAGALSTRLAGSALSKVSSTMFDSLLSSLFGSVTASGSSGSLLSLFGFAQGGVMTAQGPLPLHRYAAGGVADEPQLALFGEGAHAEAYVPLPDGRSIPVRMQGTGAATPSVSIQMSVAAQDAASFRRSEGQIGATVAAKLQRYMQRYG